MALKFPAIFLLPAHLGSEELRELEEQIPTLTYDINETEIVLGKVFRKERALFELRKHKLVTEEVAENDEVTASPRAKRVRVLGAAEDVSDTASDTASDGVVQELRKRSLSPITTATSVAVKVVKLAWFTDSLKEGAVLPLGDYVVYEGNKVTATPIKSPPKPAVNASEVLRRAMGGAASTSLAKARPTSSRGLRGRDHEHAYTPKRPNLQRQTTSEHDREKHLPLIPDYLHTTYSCQRPTPIHPPNEAFIEELTKIRTARTLIGDEVGVRAYSSAIATLAAYPHPLSSTQEVERLPGCGAKIAQLYQEFKNTGELQEAKDSESDPKLDVLRLFYEIWGVGEKTARGFYNKGWRDLDDVVEYGWDSLSRVQQIGVKYYDEFRLKIPRAEVESISDTILQHANKIRSGFHMVIVGGYRRGKTESGDVDVVLSHPSQFATKGFVERIVVSLERDKYITHTLTLGTANSERGQTPVSWKGNEKRGSGFDTLDKALVVWQQPKWSTGEAKNPSPHRRVDIIISPWKTAGCAVLGWTSGTTFERDLRRYCKTQRSLKFDSSGIRSRVDGSWVDFESGPDGQPAPDMLTAERRVFAGLELEYRPPEERCTR
ncbi:hypothetical protein B0T25DRAFT_109660 [Lasiosphaeria hispida]|uniref:DNA polymerase n=1 Tax=Lasiosphaeria hispida TaxID=260671 RepID=A0AAJ0HRA1_9PEZI|nr:hypothetical protein B0T25DRAFT_109660 [Lasiosphaeria hispida]